MQSIGWHGFEAGYRLARSGTGNSGTVFSPVSGRRWKASKVWRKAFTMGLNFGGAPGLFVAIGAVDEETGLYDLDGCFGPLPEAARQKLEQLKQSEIDWADL